jgi:hypothetical protein
VQGRGSWVYCRRSLTRLKLNPLPAIFQWKIENGELKWSQTHPVLTDSLGEMVATMLGGLTRALNLRWKMTEAKRDNRGGRRAGAGKPKGPAREFVRIGFELAPELLAGLDQLAREADQSRAYYLRDLIAQAVKTLGRP